MGRRSTKGGFLGPYLRDLRSRSGLTLRAVHTISRTMVAPVAPDYLCRAESGEFIPSAEKLITLAQVYEVPAQHLIDQIELAQTMSLAPAGNDPEECRRKGMAAAEQGDYPRAYAAFKNGLQLLLGDTQSRTGPEQTEAIAAMRTSLAIALKRLGKFKLAQQEIEAVLELKGRSNRASASALNTLAAIHYQLDRLELAEGTALLARRAAHRAGSAEGLAQALISLGNVRLDTGRHHSALRLYERALTLIPAEAAEHDRGAALVNIAICHQKLGQKALAEQAYERALAVAEGLANPRLKVACLGDYGRCLYLWGRAEEARALLRKARAMGMTHDFRPETFHATFYLWRMAQDAGLGGEAGELFKALKRLRLRVDQRSEEVVSFDAHLDEIRSSRRRKGASHAPQDDASGPGSPPDPPSHSSGGEGG